MYIKTKGKLPSVCSLNEGDHLPFLAIPQRLLRLIASLSKWKGYKNRLQNLPKYSQVPSLRQIRGGPYWAGRAKENTNLEEQWFKGFGFPKKALSWKAGGAGTMLMPLPSQQGDVTAPLSWVSTV